MSSSRVALCSLRIGLNWVYAHGCLLMVLRSSKSVPCNVAYESAEHHYEHGGQMQ